VDERGDLHIRVDKWLWAARFFKTRSLAAARVKPARPLHVGDQLEISRGPYEWSIVVRALERKRGPASDAALLYEENEASMRRREQIALEMRAPGGPAGRPRRRPTKRDRRVIARFTHREN
jgi:ribosome-associated heat shock protein Hsp15